MSTLHPAAPAHDSVVMHDTVSEALIEPESPLSWKVPEGVASARWDYRDVVLVAGEDPYAYKGIADASRAYVRPDKDGGCDR